MSYFIPSSLQKRLLRYALSRLEVLDTDALNLERLDIEWGRKSSVELKDVALRRSKLAALLQLPAAFSVEYASIANVRITVPADIYSASIEIDISNVGVRIKLLEEVSTESDKPQRQSADKLNSPRPSGRAGYTSPPLFQQRRSSSGSLEEFLEGLPSAKDLAASYLADDTSDEREQLEAALSAQPIDLQQSIALSESSDDEPITGIGTGLTLPAFLTNFFKGIGDRLKVTVHDVTLNLDLDLPALTEKESAKAGGPRSFPTTLSLHLDELHVQELKSQPTPPMSKPTLHTRQKTGGTTEKQGDTKIERRHIDLHGVRASLIAEPVAFDHPSVESTTGSLVKSEDSPIISWSENQSGVAYGSTWSRKAHDLTSRSQFDDGRASQLLNEGLDQFSPTLVPKEDRLGVDKHGLVGRTDDLIDFETKSTSETNSYSKHMHSSLAAFREERPVLTRSLRSSKQASRSFNRSPTNERLNSDFLANQTDDATAMPALRGFEVSTDLLSSPDEDEPLAESRLFSHEEAESIYLSVIEDPVVEGSILPDSEYLPMPGAWGEQSDTYVQPKGRPPAQDQSHLLDLQQAEGTDNLLHAAKVIKAVDHDGLFTDNPRAVVKSFMQLDQANVWLGDAVRIDHLREPAPSPSANVDLFSSSVSSRSFIKYESAQNPQRSHRNPSNQKTEPSTRAHTQSYDQTYDLILGLMKFSVDISTYRLLTQITQRLQLGLARQQMENQTSEQSVVDAFAGALVESLRLHVRNVKLGFVRSLDVVELKRYVSTSRQAQEHLQVPKAVMEFSASNLDFNVKDLSTFADLGFDFGKVKVTLDDTTLLSFTSETNLRSSMRDPQKSNKDISIALSRGNKALAIDITTRPIVLSANLEQLDDMLGSFGGFSALVELGSSMGSDATTRNNTIKPQGKSKSVRFEHGIKEATEKTRTETIKVNIRVGGASVALATQDHGLKLQSSAIKIVARESLTGVQINSIRLTGPYSLASETQESMVVKVENASIKFLKAPEENDLSRLIALLTPSKNKFEDDDDFLIDTLLRQRQKGSALRINISKMSVDLDDLCALFIVQQLSSDTRKLTAITRFFPEESRPGMLTLCTVDALECRANLGQELGVVDLDCKRIESAHVGSPSLVALSIGTMQLKLDESFQLIDEVLPSDDDHDQPPMLMARMIGDEMEPTARVKLWNAQLGYSVAVVTKLLNGIHNDDSDDAVLGLAASVMTLTDRSRHSLVSSKATDSLDSPARMRIDLALRDCAISLTPLAKPSHGLFVLTDARIMSAPPERKLIEVTIELRRASFLIIDDSAERVDAGTSHFTATSPGSASSSNQITRLCEQGFVSVSSISKAMINVKFLSGSDGEHDIVDVDFKDELFLLETCADSMQTLSDLLSSLKPPLPPSEGQKYRTEITPVQDMMASFSGDAFTLPPRPSDKETDVLGEEFFEDDLVTDFDDLGDTPGMSARPFHRSRAAKLSAPPVHQAFANKWESGNNKYVPVTMEELKKTPFKLKIRDMHIIWNLYDGYDWSRTREKITKAVIDVENRAEERRMRTRRNLEEDTDGSVIGDFLFNSIYIGVPLDHDPRELTRQINRNIDDLISETGTQTTTTTVRPSSGHGPRRKKLKLERSKRHKIAFELGKVSVDVFVFPAGGETQSSIDVRIHDFEIFDLVPTSTWRKFATYMHDAGPREERKPMIHLEICDVRPIPELTASELVIRATVLPMRLHVDQDALDFITRFFDFQDDAPDAEASSPEQPYLQRVEVRAVPIKLDYKPKKVDYAGLRSGRSKEFMNFFILDGADMVLKHTIIYGCSGFARLHQSLEDVWMPDIKKNQLPGILSGLNGVRTLVNVGSGLRDLVVIPVREYRKDGRIVRSISKGAVAFARQTGGEVTRFGAKLAIGAQSALQGAEGFFAGPSAKPDATWESSDLDAEEKRAISHYAEQPMGILQGLRGAARSLERDLLVTRDIIIAISGEVREGGNVEDAAKAVARHAPTLILRPMIGASKAISQTLMGATNTVDPGNRQRIEDKYKRY